MQKKYLYGVIGVLVVLLLVQGKAVLWLAKTVVVIAVGGGVVQLVVLKVQHKYWRRQKVAEARDKVYESVNRNLVEMVRILDFSADKIGTLVRKGTIQQMSADEITEFCLPDDELKRFKANVTNLDILSANVKRLFSDKAFEEVSRAVQQAYELKNLLQPLAENPESEKLREEFGTSKKTTIDSISMALEVLEREMETLPERRPG